MEYCKFCGAEIPDATSKCPRCGQPARLRLVDVSPKSRLMAALLCFFFGALGVHRFYCGRVVSGIFMILTLGGLGVWTLVDLIVILCGNFRDAGGRVVRCWGD